MTRLGPVRATGLCVGLLLAAACGGREQPSVAGISRATPTASQPAVTSAANGPTGAAPASVERVDPAIATWAQALCAITARFDADVVAAQDGVDPRTRSVPERLASAERRFSAYVESLRRQRAALDALAPPAAARPYHAALVAQMGELERLFTEQLSYFETVVIADEIEAANTRLDREAGRLEDSLALVRSRLPPAVQSALAAAEPCGDLLG